MAGLIESLMQKKMAQGEGPGKDESAMHEGVEGAGYEGQEDMLEGEEPEGPEAEGMDDGDFTPEQQANIDKFEAATLKVLYDEQGGAAENVVNALQSSEDLAQTLATLSYDMTQILDERSGNLLDGEIDVVVATEVLGQIAEIGQTAGMEIRGPEIAKATQLMLQRYMEENGIDPSQANSILAMDPMAVGDALNQDEGM